MSTADASPASLSMPPPRRSWRGAILAVVLAAHLAGLGLLLAGHGWWALAVVVASHALFFWGAAVPQSRFYAAPVQRLRTSARTVWLTIDDGPSAETEAILDLLDAHQAKATFFLVAERARQRPEAVRAIVRRGHDIGNHTLSHPSARFWCLLPAAMRRQIGVAQTELERLAGRPVHLFRAVAGMTNPFVAAVLKRHGLRLIGWNARGFDAVEADPEVVWARIARQLAPGGIVLLHEGSGHGANLAIFKRVLAGLDELGYTCRLPGAGSPPGSPPPASC